MPAMYWPVLVTHGFTGELVTDRSTDLLVTDRFTDKLMVRHTPLQAYEHGGKV